MKCERFHKRILRRHYLTFLILVSLFQPALQEAAFAFEKLDFLFQIGPEIKKGKETLKEPSGIAVAAKGRIFVADSENSRVVIFDDGGKFVRSFGEKGNKEGEFRYPRGIAASEDGRIYVADSGNHRIQVFDEKGEFIFSFGKSGSGRGELRNPKGIAVDNQGRVIVTDSDNYSICLFTADGIFLERFGGKGEKKGEFREPVDVAVNSLGDIYVADPANEIIQMFDDRLDFVKAYDKETYGIGSPAGIAVDGFGALLYSDSKNNKLIQISPDKDKPSSFGSQGKGRGQFRGLKFLLFDEKNARLYVSDSSNNRIQVFKTKSTTGIEPLARAANRRRLELEKPIVLCADDIAVVKGETIYLVDSALGKITMLGEGGAVIKGEYGLDANGRSFVGTPESIIVAESSRLYVADSKNEKIHVFDIKGKKLFDFGSGGSREGNLRNPKGLAYFGEKVLVADSGNDRIQIFNKDGIFLGKFGKRGSSAGELADPADVAVNSRGEIWVADYGNHRVQIFDSKGNFIKSLGKEGEGKGDFYKPRSIDIDRDDKAYVVDGKDGERVQIFDSSGEYLYSFGSAGRAKNEFSEISNVFVDSTRGVTLYVADKGNKRIQRIRIKQVPSPPSGLLISGGEDKGLLTWDKVKSSCLKGYRVYSKRDEEEYILKGETGANTFTIDYTTKDAGSVFAVSSVSYGGLESELSEPLTDHFRLGYEKFVGRDFEEAVRYLVKAVQANAEDGESLIFLGNSYAALKEYEKAKESFRALSRLSGYELAAGYRLGEVLIEAEEFDPALKIFNGILKNNPSELKTKRYIGEIYYRKGLYQPALKVLSESVAEGLKDARAYELLGLIYLRSKLLNKAKSSFEHAIAMMPDSARLYRGMARVHTAAGDVDKAIEDYNRAVSYDPKDAGSYLNLADLYISKENIEDAEKAINIALELRPADPEAYFLRGRILMLSGKYEDAIVSFRGVLDSNPEHKRALLNISRAYMKVGQMEEGIKNLEKFASKNPGDSEVSIELGRLRKSNGDYDGALRSFESCVSANSDFADCRREAAAIYIETGDLEKGAYHLAEVVRLSPDNVHDRLELAGIYKDLGKTGEAVVHLEGILRVDGSNSRAMYLLGSIYMENRQMTKALDYLNAAVKLSPGTAAYRNGLGLAYMEELMIDDAITEFKAACAIEPGEICQKNLNIAYDKKKSLLAKAKNAPPLEIESIELGKVFAAAYKFYANEPMGRIKIKNNGDDVFRKIKVSVSIKKYMDFPTEGIVAELKPHDIAEVGIKPTFNNSLLNISEDTVVQAEVNVEYFYGKKQNSLKATQPFTIYNRNAMTWERKDMAAAFITPKDMPVADFARAVVQMLHGENGVVDDNLNKAIQLFDALGAADVMYLVDPSNPYATVSVDYDRVDAVQFPRDTLRRKSGDCDDLSVLYAALLENIGIETTLLDVPGHLLVAFKAATQPEEAGKISSNDALYINRRGAVWIPVEATMMGKPFSEAWYEGAKEVGAAAKKGELRFIDIHKAWESFKPVTLEEPQPVALPSKKEIQSFLEKDMALQMKKGIEKLARPYLDILEEAPDDFRARLGLGILYGKKGYLNEAYAEFKRILRNKPQDASALNNMANILLEKGRVSDAVILYKQAEAADMGDAGIKMNLSLAYYSMGDLEKAREKFLEAESASAELSSRFGLLKSVLFD